METTANEPPKPDNTLDEKAVGDKIPTPEVIVSEQCSDTPEVAQENTPGETKTVPEPQVSEVKDTKKEESSSSAPKDHAKVKKTKDKSEVQGDMGTLFILDLMKQRKEKMMRKKKDDLINDLAMKKKQQMMEARMGKRVLTRPAFGGFVGVNAILAGSKNTSPVTRRRTPKPRSLEDEVDIPPPERTDLLIMGIIKDKKEEAYHKAHQVMSEQAGVPSDDKWLAKFGD